MHDSPFFMYLDTLPELSYARLVRSKARGVPIREGARAVAIAWMADGTIFPSGTIVGFDVAENEKLPRRLADALVQTTARAIYYYGGDRDFREAMRHLDFDVAPVGATFIYKRSPLPAKITLRAVTARDRILLSEQEHEFAPAFDDAAKTLIGDVDGEAVGFVTFADIDRNWTEVRASVYPSQRGHGYGAALFATIADFLQATDGRLVCAAMHGFDERARNSLEVAGFRLADYYFLGTKHVDIRR